VAPATRRYAAAMSGSESSIPATHSPKRPAKPLGHPLVGHVLGICLAAGALGILSGYCIFLLWDEKSERHEGWTFLSVLIVAALANWVGPALAGTGHAWMNLLELVGVWTIAAMALTCTLGITVAEAGDEPLKRQIATGARRGIMAGAIVAPLGSILLVLVARI